MSMDLTGIINRNEYYTNHYFAAIFAENAKETVSDWRTRSRESDYQTPWSRLREAGRRYYVLRDQYQRGTAAKPKAEIIEELAQELLAH